MAAGAASNGFPALRGRLRDAGHRLRGIGGPYAGARRAHPLGYAHPVPVRAAVLRIAGLRAAGLKAGQAAAMPPPGPPEADVTAVTAPEPVPGRRPWLRLALLLVLLAGAVTAAAVLEPQRLLTHARPPGTTGTTAVVVFALAYGLATVAFVPRPLLNAAAGALYGISAGLPAAVGGTVLGAGLAFCLGRMLGRDAVRPLLRGRWVLSADRQLSRHGFRSTLALRIVPGVPFAAANYAAAVSQVRLLPFLAATGAGSAANTAAYVVAGSRATSPTSPVFLLALAFLGATAVAGAAVVRYGRRRAR